MKTDFTKLSFRQHFVRFLMHNGALAKFYHNLSKEQDGKSVFKLDPEHWIYRAFVWEETEEGVSYWEDLDDSWEDYRKTIF